MIRGGDLGILSADSSPKQKDYGVAVQAPVAGPCFLTAVLTRFWPANRYPPRIKSRASSGGKTLQLFSLSTALEQTKPFVPENRSTFPGHSLYRHYAPKSCPYQCG